MAHLQVCSPMGIHCRFHGSDAQKQRCKCEFVRVRACFLFGSCSVQGEYNIVACFLSHRNGHAMWLQQRSQTEATFTEQTSSGRTPRSLVLDTRFHRGWGHTEGQRLLLPIRVLRDACCSGTKNPKTIHLSVIQPGICERDLLQAERTDLETANDSIL